MPIKDLCFKNPVTIKKENTLTEAAKRMEDEGVGALVVMDQNKKAVCILTDRDIVVSAVAHGKPMNTKVSEVMIKNVLCVSRDAGVAEVIDKMEKREVRRAIIVEKDDRVCGIISSDDLMQLLGNELQSLGNLVSRQVSRKGLSKAG